MSLLCGAIIVCILYRNALKNKLRAPAPPFTESETSDKPMQPGMITDDQGHTRFGDLDAETRIQRTGTFICDLSHIGWAAATGPDAATFLHSQLTNDLQNLDEGQAQLSGFCTPKGRLLCIFHIHRRSDGFVLQTNRQLLPSVLDRMRRYILRAKVELSIRDDLQGFGLCGAASSEALARLAGKLPDQVGGVVSANGATIIRHAPVSTERYQVIGPGDTLDRLWRQLADAFPCIGSWAWALSDIEQGIPTVVSETVEAFLPHSLNLDLLDAVNFKKGCYPGQEIVARMQYRGKPKSRMIRATVAARSAPLPGDKLYAPGNDQSIGMVVDAAPGGQGYELLSTVKLDHLEHGDLVLGGPEVTAISRAPLPYGFETS